MWRAHLRYSQSVINTAAQIEFIKRQLGGQGQGDGQVQAKLARLSALVATKQKTSAPKELPSAGDDSLQGLSSLDVAHISRPKAMQTLHERGINGEGVTVAVVDSGVAPHTDFGDRIKAFKDFGSRRRAPHDPKGHGTHVAGIILGDGEKIDGVAPKADLVACRISNESEAVQAVDWVIANKEKYSIDVLNLSLGAPAHADPSKDELRLAAERAVAAGLVVVAAAGNECFGDHCPSTIASPGISPQVITVGAIDDQGTVSRKDDKVWARSSQGARREGKPDLVAEGAGVVSVLSPKSVYAEQIPVGSEYLALSGSSQAAPMVAGAVALLLQVNPTLSHQQVKEILTSTADALPRVAKTSQGAGRLDLEEAVAVAQSWNSAERQAC